MATRRHVLLGATLGLAAGVFLGTQLPARFRLAEPPAPTLHPGDPRPGSSSAAAGKTSADAASAPTPQRDAANLRAELETLLARPHLPSIADWQKQVDALLAEWSATDASAALAFIAEAPRFPARARAMGVPLAELFREDAVKTAAWLRANLNEDERGKAATQAIKLLLDDEPQLAFEIARLDGVPIRPDLFGTILSRLIALSPSQGIAAFNRMNADGQIYAVDGMVTAWTEKSPSSAQGWIQGLTDPRLKQQATYAFLKKLAEVDPAQVAPAAQLLQPDASTSTDTAWSLAKTDSAAAFALLSTLPAGEQRGAQTRLLADTFSVNPDRLYAAAKASIPRDELAAVLGEGVSDWLRSDRKAAEAWLASLDDPALREQLTAAERQRELERDPAKLLESIDLNAPTKTAEINAISAISRLSFENPALAASWLSKIPQIADEDWRPVAQRYLSADEPRAITWITGLPSGDLRDQITPVLAQHWLGQGETDAAFAALESISSPDDRLFSKASLLSQFRQTDEAAALRWLEAQSMSAEDKRVLKAASDVLKRG